MPAAQSDTASDRRAALTRLAIAGTLALLLMMRLGPVLLANFPLGDGGMFSVMANDLRANGFALPTLTSYNDGSIPFVYPPLGLYILAAIPGDPIQTERWLPALYSFTAAGAAFLLADELTDRRTAIVATAAFAVMPVTWAIEGGGVTRGLAFTFLLLAWWRLLVLVRRPSVGSGVLAGLASGLALLSHPAIAPALVGSAAVFLLVHRSKAGALGVLAAGLGALIVLVPWLIAILPVHGMRPLWLGATAHATPSALVQLLANGPTGLRPFDPIYPAALLGAIIVISARSWLIPMWLIAVFLVPGGDGRYAALGWALLAAVAAVFVFDRLPSRGPAVVLTAVVASALAVTSLITAFDTFRAIDVSAVADRPNVPTPQSPDDSQVEWWPALTGRDSDIVYFGYEWTDQWDARLQAFMEARLDGIR